MKAEPFHLSGEQAATLINKILPDSETDADDERAMALLALIQLLTYGAPHDREAYSYPLMTAIYPKTHHCSERWTEYAADAARQMLGENAPSLRGFESQSAPPATTPRPDNPVIERIAESLAALIEDERTPPRIRELVNEFTLELGNVTGAFDPDPEHVRHVVSRSLAMAAEKQGDDDE